MNFKINRTHDAAFEMMVLIHINRLSSFVCVCVLCWELELVLPLSLTLCQTKMKPYDKLFASLNGRFLMSTIEMTVTWEVRNFKFSLESWNFSLISAENIQNSVHRIRRMTKVYENNVKIHDSDSRILVIPSGIPSVIQIENQLRTPCCYR